MSISTSVYENGRWVTRFQDVHHVLALNRNPQAVQVENAAEAEKPPCLGLLSRTIVQTPVYKWIIPARIRHHDKNDVLYITTESVEIKEVHGDYTLHHVTTKDDFDAPIRAARICGLPRELTRPDISAIIRKEEHWRDDMQHTHSGHNGPPPDEARDVLVKEEDFDAMTDSEYPVANEADLLSMRVVPMHKRKLSPHILVIALESGKLVFMYSVSGEAGIPQIFTSQRPLWTGHNPFLEQLGRHIAVDTRSRAMAVAAPERVFYLYKLRPMEELQREVRKFSQIDPVASEQAFEVDGTILRMEFLYPHQMDQRLVTLLLIICNRGKSRLCWYEWDVTHPLSQTHIKSQSQVLPNDDRMPLLLIPMTKLTAFILVCENRITVYADLFTGTPSRYVHSLSHRPEPEENGTSRRQPIWVQWARAMRSWIHKDQGDCIYLCREDGIVHFLTLKYDRPSLIDSNHQVGRLGTNIDTSFAVLDVGPHSSDLLAVSGDGCEGGLWQFDARKHAKKIASNPNWTPVVDLCTATATGKRINKYQPLSEKSGDDLRLIACVGKSRLGAISEIRYGIPASRILLLSVKDVLSSGILATWAFRSLHQATTYVILSHPKQTHVVRIRSDDENEDSALVDILEDSQALGLKERTLAVRSTSGDRLIQITEKALWSTPLAVVDEILDKDDPNYRSHHTFGSSRVLVSCIELDGSQAITLIATEDGGKYFLQLARVNVSYSVVGSIEIAYQPTAVALRLVGAEVIAFVGNSNRGFQIFKTENCSGTDDLHLVAEFSFIGDFSVCESVAVSVPVQDINGAFLMLFACGLRNGTMFTFDFKIQKDKSFQTNPYGKASFGDTPVEVFTTTFDPIRFIAHCQGQTFSIECHSSKGFPDGMLIHRVWMYEDTDSEWQQSQFSAIAVAEDPETSTEKNRMTELVCVDRDYLHVATLDFTCGPRNVHRRIGIGGNPVRAVYSKRLHKLIILSNRVSIIRPPRTVSGRTHTGKRTICPVISFIDLDTRSEGNLDDENAMELDMEEYPENVSPNKQYRSANQNIYETLSYEPGERFLGIIEWFPKLGDKEFHMLVVNTIIRADNNKPTTGRLLLFNVQVLGDHVTLILKKETAYRAPIYAVAAHPRKNSLVFQCGEDLAVFQLEASSTGPKTVSSNKIILRSPARHLTIRLPYIYASTAGDSLAVFRENSDGTIEYCYGDSVARQCLHHANILCRGRLIITVDMGGSLTGFWQPPYPPRIDNSLSTMFEACLPQSVVRLRAIRLPFWLKDGNQIDNMEDPEKTGVEWLTGQRLLVGISANGTVSQHKLLAPHQWPLLRFLQNLAESSPIICPLRQGPPIRHLDPDRTSSPQTRAINGDILMRLLDRGGSDLIWSLMNKSPAQEEGFLDFDSTENRWTRLRELFRQFSTMTDDLPGEETVDENEMSIETRIVKAVRKLLQSAL